MRTARNLLVALLAVVLPALALALDAPHDRTLLPGNCQECHKLHNALGASLTTQVTISDACLTCHRPRATVRPGFDWDTSQQAVRGASGIHHRWDAVAVQTGAGQVGTTLPTDTEMAKRILAGKLECSVCHNQHQANKAFSPATSMHSSFTVGTAYQKTNVSAGTANLTVTTIDAANVQPKGYRLQVTSAGNVALTHDRGLSWFRPTSSAGTTWVADAATPVGGPYSTATPLQLDDPAVTVQLTGGALVGDYWDFYVSFPMLRTANLSGSLCLTCHMDRSQGHGDVEGGGDGVRVFSHPVGEQLNANGRNYDRTAPLDADGGVQAVNGDTNATNDLKLGAGNVVGCTSCHAPHQADSNSLTVDPR